MTLSISFIGSPGVRVNSTAWNAQKELYRLKDKIGGGENVILLEEANTLRHLIYERYFKI